MVRLTDQNGSKVKFFNESSIVPIIFMYVPIQLDVPLGFSTCQVELLGCEDLQPGQSCTVACATWGSSEMFLASAYMVSTNKTGCKTMKIMYVIPQIPA